MNILKTFGAVINNLDLASIDSMVVGSLASMTYGEPRLTQDMEVVVEIHPQNLAKLIQYFDDDYCMDPTSY